MIDANTRVLHGNEQLIGFVLTGSNEHLPRSIHDSLHSFDTVHYQIENHLLQLDSIAPYPGQAASEVHHQHDAGFLHFAVS